MKLIAEIITPEKIVYKEEADEVIVPSINGQISILPNHVRLITQIVPGELIIIKDNQHFPVAITNGFMEVDNNHISILANFAERAEDIEIAKVEEAKQKAEKLMNEKATDNELKIAEAELQKTILQLRVATKYKRKTSRI